MRREDLGAGLLSEWADLFARDSSATPFSSAEWAAAWWSHWGGDAPLWGEQPGRRMMRRPSVPYLLAVREGDRLVGLAPFALRRRGGLRVLRGLGTYVGNYWDVIADDRCRVGVADAVVGALVDDSRAWDALSLDRLPPGSQLERALDASPLRVRRRVPTPSPALALPSSFDAYLAGLSAKRRKSIRHSLRPLDSGEVALAVVHDPALLPAAVARWQELRRAWWKESGREIYSEHVSERFRRFTTDALVEMVPKGMARVCELRREGELIGVALDLTGEKTFYGWLEGFDPRFARLRLGHTVIAHSIRESIDRGLRTYDFMLGDESYKYEYGAADRLLPWLVVTNPRARSRAAASSSRRIDQIRARRG